MTPYLRNLSAGQTSKFLRLTIVFFLITVISFAFWLCDAPPVSAAGQTQWLAAQNYGGLRDASNVVVIQADGKIVVGGKNGIGTFDVTHSVFALSRLLPGGSLDSTFDGDGRVTTDFPGVNSSIVALAVQPDGKIVAGGSAGSNMAIVRYNADGSLDTSFNSTGKFVLNLPSALSSIVILPSGKILAAGSISSPADQDFALLRLNSDGTPDATFGNGGMVITPIVTGGFDLISDMVVQPDGKIVAAGIADFGPVEGDGFVVVRYLPNGDSDPSFDYDSFTLTDFGEPDEGATSLVLQPDGKIVAAGYTRANSRDSIALVRFNSDGSYDAGFGGGDGKLVTSTGPGFNTRVYGMALQSNGKIVLAGFAQTGPSTGGAAVFRYLRGGSLDTSFDTDGIKLLQTGGDSPLALDVAVQPNSSIRVAGYDVNGKVSTKGFTFSIVGDQQTFADFDADGITDLSQKVGTGDWIFRFSSTGFIHDVSMHSAPSRRIVPADYDGDGRTDAAEWSSLGGSWIITESSTGLGRQPIFGTNGDIPAPADFDGDGKADLAVFRPSNGYWYINNSSDGSFSFIPWGSSGDIPVAGDYDADGRSDQAIFRRNAATGFGEWWIQYSGGGNFVTVFGTNTDVPVAADYTGDGKTDVAVWRPSDGFWFILRSEDFNYYAAPFGQAGDYLVPGDYDGDGRSDIAVFRGSTRFWYINQSSLGIIFRQFGGLGDRPIPSAFIP